MTIDLSRECAGVAAEVADGFWIVATRHQPGGSRQFPEINNRCLVFRVVEGGAPRLLVINGVEASAIAEVKRLEQQTGLAVRYVLSPGGGHHVLPTPSTSSRTRAKSPTQPWLTLVGARS